MIFEALRFHFQNMCSYFDALIVCVDGVCDGFIQGFEVIFISMCVLMSKNMFLCVLWLKTLVFLA